ncbi:MAG TPA: tRNA (adenosine(37)-N6)-dimethylallyltransferase MiaA [Flavobacterium sp.]
MSAKKYLITVVGPTAIGKTAVGIKLAQHFGCEILSADSRQFFKEMSVGTAVPSDDELAAAKHHFIHNKSIYENYTVGDYEKEAIAKLDEIYSDSDFAVLAGGSGLYVDAVLKGFDAFPEVDSILRKTITEQYENLGISYLQQELQRLDPAYSEVVAMQNPQRLMRALEICLGTGKPYSSFLNKKKNQRDFIPIQIGLEADREIIYSRINSRVDIMIGSGLLEEAQRLYPFKHLNALQTVGYRELFSYFDGEIPLDFAISEIKKNTRRFAKRQLTWFKKNQDIKWFDISQATEITSYITQEIS